MIPESPTVGDAEPPQEYFKSLTTSMTLDRRSSFKKQHESMKAAKGAQKLGVSPRLGRLNISQQGGQPKIPIIQEPVDVKKSKQHGKKISIFGTFFERKAADLAATNIVKNVRDGGFWRFPSFGRKRTPK